MFDGLGARIAGTLRSWVARTTPSPTAPPQGCEDLTKVGGDTFDWYKSLLAPCGLSPGRELLLAQMDGSEVLLQICRRVDLELLSFLSEPARFVRDLQNRIETEPLASRFRQQTKYEASMLLQFPAAAYSYDANALAQYGEIYLKRRELLIQLDDLTRSVELTLPFDDIREQVQSPAQAAAPKMRALLINFAFAQHDFAP